jgi:hypothetical protein
MQGAAFRRGRTVALLEIMSARGPCDGAQVSTSAKARLGELANELYSALCAMTPRQRGRAIRALENLNDRNCGWVLYRLREPLLGFIDDASSRRERNARARARGAR